MTTMSKFQPDNRFKYVSTPYNIAMIIALSHLIGIEP